MGGAFREVYPVVEEEVRENGRVIFLHVCLLAWRTGQSGCEDYGRRLILPPQAAAGLGTCGSSYMLISTCGDEGGRKPPAGSAAVPPAQTSTVPHWGWKTWWAQLEHSGKLANNPNWWPIKVSMLFVWYLQLSCCVMLMWSLISFPFLIDFWLFSSFVLLLHKM